jgi:hypothetical protein
LLFHFFLTPNQIADNVLDGSIPGRLFFMTNLKSLFLHNNNLQRAIPSEISRLTSLQTLRLDNNALTGNIPELPMTLIQCSMEGNGFADESMGIVRDCWL